MSPISNATAQQAYWLSRPGALTEGLRQLGTVDLRVIREVESSLSEDEAWMIQRSGGTPIWLREIVMAIDGVDAVFARSLTPLDASLGLWQGMRRLQTRPLADMLYNDPSITRSSFYQCQVHPEQPLYRTARFAFEALCPPANQLLARSSVFWRVGEPLLVAECFLPAFWTIAPDH